MLNFCFTISEERTFTMRKKNETPRRWDKGYPNGSRRQRIPAAQLQQQEEEESGSDTSEVTSAVVIRCSNTLQQSLGPTVPLSLFNEALEEISKSWNSRLLHIRRAIEREITSSADLSQTSKDIATEIVRSHMDFWRNMLIK